MADSTSLGDLFNTKEKKLAFFQNLILVAVADRHVDEQESEFLLAIGEKLDLSEEDTRSITDSLSSLSFIIPQEGLQKTVELQTLVMMMVQDGKIDESEYNLCLEYARRIGFSKEILDDFIAQLDKSQG
jgi:uncharacterized tellurite resistance protein B-like protein